MSISTVSLVINDKGYVSAETRERVKEAAKSLNFVPRQAARALPSNRTGNIGFVIREDHFRRTEPFYTGVYLGTEFEANNQHLYVLLATIPSPYVSGDHVPRFLRNVNVDGILVAGKVDDAFITEAETSGLPVVLIDYEHGELPAALIDNQGGAHAATQHLIERGHTSLALLGADIEHPSLDARRAGFQLACAEAGLPAEQVQFLIADDAEPDFETGKALSKILFESSTRPSAVFCINDATALAVLEQAIVLGIKVPDELAVVGFDDVPQARHGHPPLTTVRVRTEQLGEAAMRYLVELINAAPAEAGRFERASHRVSIPTELIVRDST